MKTAPEKSVTGPLPFRLVMLGGAVILLLLGVFFFNRARIAHVQAEMQFSEANHLLVAANDRQQLAQRNRALLSEVQQLQKQASEKSYLASQWGERQINLKQQNLARAQVNPLLLASAKTKDQLLKLEEFDLSVTHADEGLFDVIINSRQPLLLSFRGSLYFRLAERSL
ncbi:MAG: hypothetical protein HY253_07335 [Burkholderiales bacterium]|nr:hypothetical protein [Burkholderiales bacterium]